MKKTQTRFKFLAFFLAAIMLLGAMPLGIFAEGEDTLYYATFAYEDFIPYMLDDAEGYLIPYRYDQSGAADFVRLTEFDFPETLIVRRDYADGEPTAYFYVTNEDWPTELDAYRYVWEEELVIGDVYDPDVTRLESQIGSFNASVEGSTVPTDAKLQIESVAEKDVDPGIWERKDVNMKSFVACFDLKIVQGETEWQPNGKKVTVTMNAAALGLYTGQEVYIIHMHENADGSKEYEILGPTYVVNGKFSFKTDKFSTYAVFQGQGAVALKNSYTQSSPEIIWAEPGSTIMLVVETNQGVAAISIDQETLTNTNPTEITFGTVELDAVGWDKICGGSGDTTAQVNISANATTTDYVILHCTSGDDIDTWVRINVGTRAKVTEIALQNYPLQISIRKPDANGTFPSEPTTTEYTSDYYFFLNNGNNDVNQANDTIGTTVTNYSATADTFLDPAEMGKTFGWMYDAQGKAIGGVIDALGYYTKECFVDETVDWKEIANIIANYNDTQITNSPNSTVATLIGNGTLVSVQYRQEVSAENDTDGNQDGFMTFAIVLTTDDTKTIDSYTDGVKNYDLVYYGEFELIPYVIKLMSSEVSDDSFWYNTTSASVWHVDIALVRGDAYTLSYELNLGADIVTETAIVLPTAQVFVEDPTDRDPNGEINTSLSYTFSDDDVPKNAAGDPITTIQVKHITTGKTTTATFLGWNDQTTRPTGQKLYGPLDENNETIELSANTKLYAIWHLDEGLGVQTTTFSVNKQVFVATGSPAGAVKPAFGDSDFAYFQFSVEILYDPAETANKDIDLGGMYFEAGKWDPQTKEIVSIPSLPTDGSSFNPVTLKELCAGETLSFLTVTQETGKVILTFELADGEYINFLNVPFFTVASETQYNSYVVKEATIPTELQNRYSAYTSEQTIVLSEISSSLATFYNYYTPPVAGLQINVAGDDGEFFIFEVLQRVDGQEDILYATIVAPANGTATIVGLWAGESVEYIVREKSTGEAWSWRWGTMSEQTAPAFDDAGNAVVTFTPSSANNKWLFGNSRSSTTNTVTKSTTN
ncbi:MAG: hypothetical protein IJY50_08455 [Clostridia bacterium]|nr:hypothetical protein [Clostridia bacterium]